MQQQLTIMVSPTYASLIASGLNTLLGVQALKDHLDISDKEYEACDILHDILKRSVARQEAVKEGV